MTNFPAPQGSEPATLKLKKPFWQRPWVWIVGVALVVFGVAGSQQPNEESSTQDAVTTEVADTTTAEAPQQPPVTEAAAITPAPPVTQPVPAPPPSPVQAAPAALMPIVPCGMDLQAAQDLIQTTGVFLSRSEDATGQGRMQISDRNWTVLYAIPDPGTPIGEGDAVFFVVKDEEFRGC